MTGPVNAARPREPLTPPRHGHLTRAEHLKKYEQALVQAENDAGAAIDRLLQDYLHILEVAGSAYARETERAMRAYNTIEQPARKAYERQSDIAMHAYESIIGPADAELQRISTAAHEMYKRAITPIENAYAKAISDAQALAQNVTLPQVPAG